MCAGKCNYVSMYITNSKFLQHDVLSGDCHLGWVIPINAVMT